MALSRISRCPDLLNTINRGLQPVAAGSYPINELQYKRRATIPNGKTKGLHASSVRRYPDAPTLPLPNNVSEIFANETGRFTPERARDIATPILIYSANKVASNSSFSSSNDQKFSFDGQRNYSFAQDTHVDSYDCSGAVSLNSSMQSNVPKPFCSAGKSTHFNMPGGQWAKDSKYIAEDMQKSYYRISSAKNLSSNRSKNGIINKAILTNTLYGTVLHPTYIHYMEYSSSASSSSDRPIDTTEEDKLIKSKKERLKLIVRQYGSTILVFHIGISLISLGICYTAVVSGLDVKSFIETYLPVENEEVKKVLNNTSQFLVAYGIHKFTAPIRITITLACAPALVRYLRSKGILNSIDRSIVQKRNVQKSVTKKEC